MMNKPKLLIYKRKEHKRERKRGELEDRQRKEYRKQELNMLIVDSISVSQARYRLRRK